MQFLNRINIKNMLNFKVVLIVNSPIGSTYGLNIIAAKLKQLGAEVRVLYLTEITKSIIPTQTIMSAAKNTPGCMEFSEPVVEQVLGICKDASLVGVSLLTSGFFNAVQLTKRIKESIGDIPVIWGGKHPTINPTECLQHADVVCVGEGEMSMTEYVQGLMNNELRNDIHGLWFRGDSIKNPIVSFVENLDELPFPDQGPADHYLIDNEVIREVTQKDTDKYLLRQYPTMIARGCPMKCTFCTNSVDKNRRLRIRSVDRVIDEIKYVQDKYGPIQRVMFRDDTIMSLKLDYIEEFSSKWKTKVGLPFSSSGVIPTAVREDKLNLLLDVGFVSVKMGIQSGSKNVRKDIYWRPETDEHIIKAANIFKKLKIKKIGYMFITDNPWETEEDIVTSLRFISRLPRPFSLSLYSLNLYPGTELFNRALREGLIKDPHEWYNKSTMTLKKNYFNMLYMMQRNREVPRWLITLLTSEFLYRNRFYISVFTRLYGWFFRNLSEYGVERKVIKPATFWHKIAEVFIKIFMKKSMSLKAMEIYLRK